MTLNVPFTEEMGRVQAQQTRLESKVDKLLEFKSEPTRRLKAPWYCTVPHLKFSCKIFAHSTHTHTPSVDNGPNLGKG
jgi:hypothetical protein